MTHNYHVTGMTCAGCQVKVQSLLSKVDGVKKVSIDLPSETATIDMERHISTSSLQNALKDYPKYQLSESSDVHHQMEPSEDGETRSWFQTYKPILLIFAYITTTTVLLEILKGGFNWEVWMMHFMAGFFLVFSFFKLLDLRGFADSYSTYDIIAKRWRPWGYVYAFIELALGLAFLTGFDPLITNGVTFVVMTISIIGVLQSVLNKRKIRCACLGAVFNLPMSTVTIIEDALMIGMSAFMLIKIL
ncbi:MAG: heavy-metal-associated domain-containing protein [Sphingobacteriales bacterium]|nr:MAG: heavy-metal-associated domain-containing protein [Sphingobacteriales bacterium]